MDQIQKLAYKTSKLKAVHIVKLRLEAKKATSISKLKIKKIKKKAQAAKMNSLVIILNLKYLNRKDRYNN